MNRQKTGAGLKGVSYLVDKRGHRKAVLIDFSVHKKALEEFLEDLYGRQKIKERKSEPTISKTRFLKNLKAKNLI